MHLSGRVVLIVPLVAFAAAACSSASPDERHERVAKTSSAITDADITPADPTDWPSSSSPGYQQAFQGLAHDETNWYLANQCAIYKVPVTHDLDDHDGHFLSRYAGDVIPCFGPLWLAPGEHSYNCPQELDNPLDAITIGPSSTSYAALHAAYVTTRAMPRWPDTACNVQFKHLGDPAFHGDYLYVPVEAVDGAAAIAVFDRAFSLVGMDLLQISDGHGGMTPVTSAPFVAVQHDTGLVFTSPYDDAHEVRAFRAEFTGASGTGLRLTHVPEASIYVHYASGAAAHISRLAGGEFAPDGNLYLAGDELGFQGGIHVVSPTGLHLASIPVDYDPHKSCTVVGCPEELEGLTFWDLDGRGAPAGKKLTELGVVPRNLEGQLHLSQNQSYAGVSDDNLWIHHYRVADPVEGATRLPTSTTVTTRTPDPGDPDKDLWTFTVDPSALGYLDIRIDNARGLGIHVYNAYDPTKTIALTASAGGSRLESVAPPVAGTYLLSVTGLATHAPPRISFRSVLPPLVPKGCRASAVCDSEVDFYCATNEDSLVLQRKNGAGGWDQVAAGSSHPPLPDLVDASVPDAIVVATYRVCAVNAWPTPTCADPFDVTVNHALCGGGGSDGGGFTGCVRLSNGKLRCKTTH